MKIRIRGVAPRSFKENEGSCPGLLSVVVVLVGPGSVVARGAVADVDLGAGGLEDGCVEDEDDGGGV